MLLLGISSLEIFEHNIRSLWHVTMNEEANWVRKWHKKYSATAKP